MDSCVCILAYAVLAMAHHQLEQPDKCSAAFIKAATLTSKLPPMAGRVGGLWDDWIIAHVMMDEATALIEGATPGNTILKAQNPD